MSCGPLDIIANHRIERPVRAGDVVSEAKPSWGGFPFVRGLMVAWNVLEGQVESLGKVQGGNGLCMHTVLIVDAISGKFSGELCGTALPLSKGKGQGYPPV